jgi:hypothetical protein
VTLTVLRNSILTSLTNSVLLLAAIFVFFPQKCFAWTPEIKAAVQAVADGTATPQQKALAFRSNFEVNMMAEQGELPLADYQKVQNVFSEQAQQFMKDAAQDAGLTGFEPQAVDPNKPATPKPGTDVDGHMIRRPGVPDQQITARDVANARQSFNDRVNAYLTDNGLEPLENPSRQLKADNMPAEAITPKEAAASSSYINKDGGTAYSDPVAAEVEAYLRGAGPKPSSLVDWARYVSEQQRQIMNHDHTDHLTDAISKGANAEPGGQEYIDLQNNKGEVQLEAEQTGKYQERINRAATAVGNETGVPADLPVTTGRAASELVTANRGPGMGPIAGIVDALRENTTLSNTESFVDTVARIAQQNPELRGEASEAIAEATRNLTPSQRGAILERIGNDAALGGKDAASQVAEAMRNNSVPDTGLEVNSKHAQPAAAEPETPPSGKGEPGNVISGIDEAAGEAIGVGELGAEAGVARQGLNTVAGGTATVVGGALTALQLGQNIGQYAEGIDRGMDANTTDQEANQAFQQAQNAANNTAIVGTLGAAAAASPVIVGGTLTGIGAYQGTRHILETTKAGKAVDNTVLNGIDGATQKIEAGTERIKGALGLETQQQREQNQLDGLRASFARALDRGDISIKDGHTKEELMELLAHSDSNTFQSDLAAIVNRHPSNQDSGKTSDSRASSSDQEPVKADDTKASKEDTSEDSDENSDAFEPEQPADDDSTAEPDSTEDNSAAEPDNSDQSASNSDADAEGSGEPDTTLQPAEQDSGVASEPDTTEDNSAAEPDNSDQSAGNSGADAEGSDDSDCGCGDAENSAPAEPNATQEPGDVDDSVSERDNTDELSAESSGASESTDNSGTDEPDEVHLDPTAGLLE